ncbi:hypothetical protein ACFQZZ_33090 [Nocardia sp. GCM10030253]|uniref:hypothetical protein n=1 Tax=Nocardia sp. GCM10030253 TaxID=3273404 RepID=UPI0036293E52
MSITRVLAVLGALTAAALLTACDPAEGSQGGNPPVDIPIYVCDTAVVVRPLGYSDGDTVYVVGRGNCTASDSAAAQGITMKGYWRIAERNGAIAVYDCGKNLMALEGPDGKRIEFITTTGDVSNAPAYVNGYYCN